MGPIELEHLMIQDGGRRDTDQAVHEQEWRNAVCKTVGVLQKTEEHFKSKDLGDSRKELETLLTGRQI